MLRDLGRRLPFTNILPEINKNLVRGITSLWVVFDPNDGANTDENLNGLKSIVSIIIIVLAKCGTSDLFFVRLMRTKKYTNTTKIINVNPF